MKLCTECIYASTKTGERFTFENPSKQKIVLFTYCSFHKDTQELNTQTQQLCDDWTSWDDENLDEEFQMLTELRKENNRGI